MYRDSAIVLDLNRPHALDLDFDPSHRGHCSIFVDGRSLDEWVRVMIAVNTVYFTVAMQIGALYMCAALVRHVVQAEMTFDVFWIELGARSESRDVPEHEIVQDGMIAVNLEALADHQAAFDVKVVEMREDIEYNLSWTDREVANVICRAGAC